MYFAVNSTQKNQVRQALMEALNQGLGAQAKSSAPRANCLALIDTAFDFAAPQLEWDQAAVPLYLREDLEALVAVSPALLTLAPYPSPRFDQQLELLLQHCDARPMLSFLFTEHGPSELRSRWQSLLTTATEDGQEFLLRFADTRVSAALPQALSARHWARLHGPIQQWWIINRAGELQRLPVPGRGLETQLAATAAEAPARLTDAHLSALMQASEPDTLIESVAQSMPDLLERRGAAALYQQMSSICQFAYDHRIEAHADQFALAVASLADPSFLARVGLSAQLKTQAWEPGGLASLLQTLGASA